MSIIIAHSSRTIYITPLINKYRTCTNILQFDPRNESDRAKIYSSHRAAFVGWRHLQNVYSTSILDEWRPRISGCKCAFLSVSTCCTSTKQSCNERSCCLNANRAVMLIRNLSRSPFFPSLFYSSLSFSVFQSFPFYFSLLPPTWLVNYVARRRTAIYKRRSFSISLHVIVLFSLNIL